MALAGRCYYTFCLTPVGHAVCRSVLGFLRWGGAFKRFYFPLDALALDHASTRGLMQLWRRIHWADGGGMMPAEQMLALYGLAATWPVAGDVVELGSWCGLTTCYLATACRAYGEGRVYAVDTFRGTKEGHTTYQAVKRRGGETFTEFTEQVKEACVTDVVTPLVGLTTDVAGCYPGRCIRVMLIDADHSFDGVRADFEAWLPHVAPGGLMIFHDHDMPEVARFIDAVVIRHPSIDPSPGLVVDNVFAVTKRLWSARSMASNRCSAASQLDIPAGGRAMAEVPVGPHRAR